MQHTGLFPLVRRKVQQFLNGYIQSTQITERIKEYIVPPVLGNQAGVLGAIALAIEHLHVLEVCDETVGNQRDHA